MSSRTRAVVLGILVIALLALAGCGGETRTTPTTPGTSPGSTTGKSVSIKNFSFDPSSLTVDVGDRVVWTNDDDVDHTVTGTGLDSGTLKPGDTYSFTFDTAGTYNYQCTLHPAMQGQVVVE
ncbi:MAG: cupredoxin family copper-binding protein [Actinobacteria bacterium]|nr:cupredoxin family copper-binding protein [Actinomycetota bacterium]MBU1942580.1 cupredoxin family copper-binding protein [Actinomycetota bacterium]MBU2688744.1 cupredoxin family copper-binding protein [Actinomycetota bacterium]